MLYSIQNDNKELCKTMPEVNRLAGSGVEAPKPLDLVVWREPNPMSRIKTINNETYYEKD